MKPSVTSANFSSAAGLPASKDRQFFAELVVELEQQIAVNDIVHDGIKLWPMIRWMLAKEIKGTAVDKSVKNSLDAVRSESFTGGREERQELMKKRQQQERDANPDPQAQI